MQECLESKRMLIRGSSIYSNSGNIRHSDKLTKECCTAQSLKGGRLCDCMLHKRNKSRKMKTSDLGKRELSSSCEDKGSWDEDETGMRNLTQKCTWSRWPEGLRWLQQGISGENSRPSRLSAEGKVRFQS